MKRILLLLAIDLAAFGISGGRTAGIKRLFMIHPPLEERIAALQTVESQREA
jgi:heat shock protein HtpX